MKEQIENVKKALEDLEKKVLTSEARDNLDDSDFAYIDSKGGKHLPIHNRQHVISARGRFNQTNFESDEAKEKAKRKIQAKGKKYGLPDWS